MFIVTFGFVPEKTLYVLLFPSFFIFTEAKWNSCYSLMDQNKFDWWKHDIFIATAYFQTMQNISRTFLYKVFQIEMVDYFIGSSE